MAMGNISAATNQMATKASMVGFVPRDSVLKEVKKEEDHSTTVRELDEQDTSNQSARGGQDAPGTKTPQQTPDNQPRVRQRQISAPQQQATQQTEEKTEGGEAKATPQATPQGGQAGGARGPVPFDTSAQIQWKFNQAQADQTNSTDNPQTQPEVQKRQFLTRLRGMVSTEYQQYVKSDSALYSRRNLREIMQALNQDDPNSKRLKSEQDSRRNDEVPGELEGYSKFNAMRAARSLKVVQEHQQEPQQDRLLLVA